MEEAAAGIFPVAAQSQVDCAVTYFRNHWQADERWLLPVQGIAHRIKRYRGGLQDAGQALAMRIDMRWKQSGDGILLSLHALVLTASRLEQCWSKIDRFGFFRHNQSNID